MFGRWDDTKGAANVEFMPTLLSRFDNIFVIKDHHDKSMDIKLAKHVIRVHTTGKPKLHVCDASSYYENNILRRNDNVTTDLDTKEIQLDVMKRYIDYCRKRCAPRLTTEAAAKLRSRYVLMRSEQSSGGRGSVCITIRQLESTIRTSEALAKMQLKPFANEDHVDEAIRLFQISTLAVMTHLESGATTTETDADVTDLLESQLKARLPIGSKVTEANIMQEFKMHGYRDEVITRVIASLLRRGTLRHQQQRTFVCRVAN